MKVRALATFLVLVSCHPREKPRRLNFYCSTPVEWCEKMKGEFERETGVEVSMLRKSTGEMFAQIWAERKNPKGDVWWGGTGDSHIQGATAKISEPFHPELERELRPWAIDPAKSGEYRTTGIYMGILGFGYNSEWLAKKNIAPPGSWTDLLDPRFRGEIQMANPASSGTAYTALVTFVTLFGEDAAFDYLKKLDRNITQYTKSGAAPVRAAARGEAGVGIVFVADAYAERDSGFPIVPVIPPEGTGYEIGCMSLLRGARHPEEARRFANWALEARVQSWAGEVKMYQFLSNRTATAARGGPKLADVKLLDIDLDRFSKKEERERLLERFRTEVRAQ
ncbi:MAG: ABC transporter substrate-binding protein [Deltaproteobacteria bacterium]|nr:ABC transporter substrate-binding protein [Deltaproteobacteria bacterium]